MNSEIIAREFEEYRRADKAAQDLLDRADSEKRSLTAEEEASFDAAFEAASKAKARSDKLVQMDEDGKALAEAVRSRIGDVTDSESGHPADAPRGDKALLANIRSLQGEYRRNEALEGRELAISALVDLEKRAIADFSDSGALYTTDFQTKVAVYQRTVSPWINVATVINANNGRPLNLPNLTVDPTVYAPGEGTAITESTPTIGSAALVTTAYKALSYISFEAEEDELVGILDYIARVQGRSIGLKFGSDLTGSLVTAMTNGGTAAGVGGSGTATAALFGYEDLIDLKMSMAVPYRQNGSWVMSNGAIKKVRKFKDQNGLYFYNAASNPQGYATFDGDAVYEDPYLAAPASASKSVVFGDLSAVVIKQMPLRIATSADFRFANDQIALKTVYRAGGSLPDVAALRYLVSANS